MATLRHPPAPAPSSSPAPWTTACETYWLITWPSIPLSKGTYAPLESSNPCNTLTQPISGPGMIQIVRYTSTPVGPYDELVYLPGYFSTPGGIHKGKKRLRVTRIYVSQREICRAGRANWNIPKHLARLEFSAPPVVKGETPPRQLEVKVFPPGEDGNVEPFFHATLTPASWLPSFPLSTRWMPLSTVLVQPPLPQGEDRDLVGTDVWQGVEMVASAKKTRVMRVEQHGTEESEQGKWWPAVRPWRLGVWLEDAMLEIPVPEEFEV